MSRGPPVARASRPPPTSKPAQRLTASKIGPPVARASRRRPDLVYEDLARYKMRRDRPKNENAGLARWSHRSILKYAQHIGGLFGVPAATAPAAYSSRFCHRCGAPGCRAVQFDPAWLDEDWMRRVLASNDLRDAAMKGVASRVADAVRDNPQAFAHPESWPWVLRDGGTHFVCSNRDCASHRQPVDADENAAANIGLWFLRGVDDFRVQISASGRPVKPLRFLAVDHFERMGTDADAFWQPVQGHKARKEKPSDEEANEEEVDDVQPQGTSLFRDPSGNSFSADRWYTPKWFWGEVAWFASAGIKAANGSIWSEQGD